ncbi:putative non-specific serine/threonine protein kinase [Helianthus anomalus]
MWSLLLGSVMRIKRRSLLICKYEAKGSLDRYLSDPVTLTWTQRLHICLDIARANWEAKLSGFRHSTMQPAARRHGLVLDEALGTAAYMDPAYVASLTVTHKSDVYLLGVVLFEVLTGKKADFSIDT